VVLILMDNLLACDCRPPTPTPQPVLRRFED
jgi:hypothetical protein